MTLLFLVVVVPSAATLLWLGLRLLDDDRRLVGQRDMEHREATAEAILRSLGQSLAEAERSTADGDGPPGVIRVSLSANAVEVHPAGVLLWTPVVRALPEAAALRFASAEIAEFRGTGDRGLAEYESASRASDSAVKAAGLLRVARVRRRQGDVDGAVRAYRRLSTIRGVAIDGTPADLVGRRALCDVLAGASRADELRHEVALLESDLLANRWALDRISWQLAADDLSRWTGRAGSFPSDRLATSGAVEWLWESRSAGRGERLSPTGRRVVDIGGTPMTVLWRADAARLDAVVISPDVIRAWVARATPAGFDSRQISVRGDAGQPVFGARLPAATWLVSRTPSESGLPWTLTIGPSQSSEDQGQLTARARLLSAGFAAILLLLAGGSYLLWLAVQREIAVAQLQTDFVAAVSHEFRTPLTALRHVTELLDEDDEMTRARRRSFYAVIGRSTGRLQHLVESLLDFARMEGGRRPYARAAIDVSALTNGVASDFRSESDARGDAITLNLNVVRGLEVQGDAAALGRALWNLLDNAVKYSSVQPVIDVSARVHPKGVAIEVRDEGFGIPEGEQRDIFLKFVRGEQAASLGVRGTGLGLAMVSHIVAAHGGVVELESSVGHGSTFRIILPGRLPIVAYDDGVGARVAGQSQPAVPRD